MAARGERDAGGLLDGVHGEGRYHFGIGFVEGFDLKGVIVGRLRHVHAARLVAIAAGANRAANHRIDAAQPPKRARNAARWSIASRLMRRSPSWS